MGASSSSGSSSSSSNSISSCGSSSSSSSRRVVVPIRYAFPFRRNAIYNTDQAWTLLRSVSLERHIGLARVSSPSPFEKVLYPPKSEFAFFCNFFIGSPEGFPMVSEGFP